MKITKQQLKQLIKEELENVLEEVTDPQLVKSMNALEKPIMDLYNYYVQNYERFSDENSTLMGGRMDSKKAARDAVLAVAEGIMTVGLGVVMHGRPQSDADVERQEYERRASDAGAQDIPGAKGVADHVFRSIQALRGK